MKKCIIIFLILSGITSFAQNLKDRIQGDWVSTKIIDSKGNPATGKFGESSRFLKFSFNKSKFTISQAPYDKGMTFPYDINFINENAFDWFPTAKYNLEERIYWVKELGGNKMILSTLSKTGDSIFYHFINQKLVIFNRHDTIDNGSILITKIKSGKEAHLVIDRTVETRITNDPVYLTPRPLFEGLFEDEVSHIKLPVDFKSEDVSKELVLEFDVSEKGAENYKIVRGLSDEINNEILKIVDKVHKNWKPVRINDLPVKTTMKFHIYFNTSSTEQNIPFQKEEAKVKAKVTLYPVDLRFKDKEAGLVKFLYDNLKYPENSVKNKSVGYSITAITITPNGDIKEISNINPIDNYIDKDISDVLLKTRDKWLKSDTAKVDETFYVQVLYRLKMHGIKNEPYNSKVGVLNLIEPVFLSEEVSDKKDLPAANDYIVVKLSENLKNGNNEETIKNIDELIRRNPFKKELYQLRITVDKNLKRNDLMVKDAEKLQNFIQGVSLDDLINSNSGRGEGKDSVLQSEKKVIIETMPEYPGGEKEMMKFIHDNLKYPFEAQTQGIQGTVIVKFVIDREGIIIKPEIMLSPHPLLSAEALRIINMMPDWKPGMQDGKRVLVTLTFPIKFIMD